MHYSPWNLGGLVLYCLVTTSSVRAQIVPDRTLPNNSNVPTKCTVCTIKGGTVRGSNLFHSFSEFSVPKNGEAFFKNTSKIENIFSRVTGSSVSDINGRIQANGTANLFLINPNGIIFGPKAELKIGGSFVGSTASSLVFKDSTQFSATNPQPSSTLLTVSAPTGLQFGGTVGTIRNQSQATDLVNIPGVPFPISEPVGLQVKPGETLALVGGNVLMEGGMLTAPGGRIELGSVTGAGLTGLIPVPQGWTLGYEGVQSFQDIRLSQMANVNASGSNGSISGNIYIRGKLVELVGDSRIISLNEANLNGGSISVRAKQLNLKDGSQINVGTFGAGQAGDLTVTADSIELVGTSKTIQDVSGLFSQTKDGTGRAGNLTIRTGRLIIREGAQVGASTFDKGTAGSLTVDASEVVLSGTGTLLGGDLISSGLFAQANPGTAETGGNLAIKTQQLIVQDGAKIAVRNQGLGDAGNLEVKARSILLDNQGSLTAEAALGKGGNITINTDTLVGLRNSDITANAFEGEGGFIDITAQGIFGLEVRDPTNDINELRNNNTSDISASSLEDPSLNGVVQINTPDVDPNEGVVALPEQVVDVSGLVAQRCPAGGSAVARGSSEFVATGRGGLPPTPKEALKSDMVLVDLGTPMLSSPKSSPASREQLPMISGRAALEEPLRRAKGHTENDANSASSNLTHSAATPIVEAQGWVRGPKGQVVLTAQASTVASDDSRLTSATCHGF